MRRRTSLVSKSAEFRGSLVVENLCVKKLTSTMSILNVDSLWCSIILLSCSASAKQVG
jgi:hypothetical protein